MKIHIQVRANYHAARRIRNLCGYGILLGYPLGLFCVTYADQRHPFPMLFGAACLVGAILSTIEGAKMAFYAWLLSPVEDD